MKKMTNNHVTLKTSVSERGMTNLIQRLGQDCLPTQFIREFVQNGIEAIERTGKPGVVEFDNNHELFAETGVYKMTFTDSGDGMTCEEMRHNLNNLSASGAADNTHENYGMGAKISALTRNHEGVMYESVKNNDANMIVIHYNDDQGVYGIKPLDYDGGVSWCTPLENASLPKTMQQHGTRVTLFGMSPSEDTMQSVLAAKKGTRENWIGQYVNTRFFTIPESVELKARVGYYREDNKRHNYLRNVKGQKATFDSHALKKGTVQLSDAKIHWWILNEDRQSHGREYITAHSGCVNQGETFNLADGRGNKCPGFGVIFGKENVMLYIEPNRDYVQNTTRTALLKRDDSELPWSRWMEEFREVTPPEMKSYMEEKAKKATATSHFDSIKERLKSVSNFFIVSAYKPTKDGQHRAGVEKIDGEVNQERFGEPNPSPIPNPSFNPSPGSRQGSIEAAMRARAKKRGIPANKNIPDCFPKVVWVSVEDDSRQEADTLEDRAAEFYQPDNLIRANADFQAFKDVEVYFQQKYKAIEGAQVLITEIVREAFEQQLTEVVAGALSLRSRSLWGPDNFDSAVNPEALTTACMGRYHLINQTTLQLRSKLGKVA